MQGSGVEAQLCRGRDEEDYCTHSSSDLGSMPACTGLDPSPNLLGSALLLCPLTKA